MANDFGERRAQMFPRLSAEQIERLSKCGKRRRVARGTILFDQGDISRNFHVVISGEMEVVHLVDGREEPITVLHAPGQFTGESSILTGRRTLVRGRMCEDGELLEMTPDALRKVVQSDSELSEILLRAFILRRVALIADHRGDAVMIGSSHSAATLRIREFLTRNGQPHTYLDVEGDPGVQTLLDRFQLRLEDVPVVISRYDRVLKNPTNAEVADCLGLNVAIEPDRVRDVGVVGAGPAGVGVYSGASGMEAQLCKGEDVIVVGGGNSAGQAAIFLARTARHVLVVVRGKGLAETMSRYLIQRIEASGNITLRTFTEVSGLEGNGRLERVHLRDSRTNERFPMPIRHLFLMTGASPNTGWLTDCVALDGKGFVKTGPDLTEENLAPWQMKRH